MFVAWSPMRSRAFETEISSTPWSIEAGSRCMASISSWMIRRLARSTCASSSQMRRASWASPRTKESMLWRSMRAHVSTISRMRGGTAISDLAENETERSAMLAARSAMRSRSFSILRQATMKRRSLATGLCSARILRHSSSSSTSWRSISSSPSMTRSASSMRRSSSARIERRTASSTSPARNSMRRSRPSRSRVRCLLIRVCRAEPSRSGR